MNYIVFDTEEQMAEANGRWLLARYNAGIRDCRCDDPVDPQITSAWDWGKTIVKYNVKAMLNGKIACQVPRQWKVEFMGTAGVEIKLTEDDFTEVAEVI